MQNGVRFSRLQSGLNIWKSPVRSKEERIFLPDTSHLMQDYGNDDYDPRQKVFVFVPSRLTPSRLKSLVIMGECQQCYP